VYRQLGLLRAETHAKGLLADALLAELTALGSGSGKRARRSHRLQES
jgi:hypothetical protein